MIKSVLIFLLIVFSVTVSGQRKGINGLITSSSSGKPDYNTLVSLQKKYLEKVYFSSVTASNELINGKEYVPYFYRSGTNPLLLVNRSRAATLYLRDMQFRDLNLQYDTYRDEVIYSDNKRMIDGRFPQIVLNRNNIAGFSLYFGYDSMIFRYFRFPAGYAEKMKNGFYEVGYEGKYLFLIRHRSTIYNKEGVDKYAYSPSRYIFTGSSWQKITIKKSFLRIFGSKEKEIKAFIHRSRIKVPSATRDQIAQILRYYDNLEKNPG